MSIWSVNFNVSAAKQVKKLPERVQKRLRALVSEIEIRGPIQIRWQNYSKLTKNLYHCHLTYRYVAVWRVDSKNNKIIRFVYVGTREKAPY